MVTLADINIWGRRAATVLWNESTQSRMNIKHPEEVIARVLDAVAAWSQIASEVGVPTDIIHAIGQTHLYV
ncbi:MAG: hypothetical protein IJT75_01915 [Bacteroidaceae bacterium]|nr:hypothetical protein [Bacteroidaceae bacterium]